MTRGFDLGEKNCKCKLDVEIVKEIRRLYASGYKTKKLSELYDVTVKTIRDIIYNKTWKHI